MCIVSRLATVVEDILEFLHNEKPQSFSSTILQNLSELGAETHKLENENFHSEKELSKIIGITVVLLIEDSRSISG